MTLYYDWSAQNLQTDNKILNNVILRIATTLFY